MTEHIEELPTPAALDGSPEARDFAESLEVRNAAELASIGTDDFRIEPVDALPSWLDTENEPKRQFVVREGGRIVGRGALEWRSAGESADVSWQEVHVLPEFSRRGIGLALAEHLEQVARADGKHRLVARVNSAPGPGEQMHPVSGSGGIHRENREVRFLLERGYSLRQVTRAIRLPLPADPERLTALRRRAEEKAGADYRVHFWGAATPPEWREDMALVTTRLWQDVPLGGVPYPGMGGDAEDPWTVERLVAEEEKHVSGPAERITAAVEHVPSGHVVGYTALAVPPDPARVVGQEATVVIGEHRGHRLALLLKVANIEELQRRHPARRGIATGTAEDNRFMLDINEALGFVPTFSAGAWTKDL